MSSALEAKFDHLWKAVGGFPLCNEVKFAPNGNWSFDRALPSLRIAFEIEGGTWAGGRHTSGAGYEGDCEKYNQAAAMGWKVFRLTSTQLKFQYLKAIFVALRDGTHIDFRFPRKSRRGKLTKLKRLLMEKRQCNSHRRSGDAPSSSSP